MTLACGCGEWLRHHCRPAYRGATWDRCVAGIMNRRIELLTLFEVADQWESRLSHRMTPCANLTCPRRVAPAGECDGRGRAPWPLAPHPSMLRFPGDTNRARCFS